MCKVSFGLVGNLKAQLQELHRSQPHGTADKNVIGEMTRLECVVTLAKIDLNALRQWNQG